jgi:biotin operon repressor
MPKSFIQQKMEWLESLQDAGVSPSAFAVAFAISRCLNSVSGEAWPSQKWIGERTGLSARQVRDLIKGLSEAGYLVVARGGYQKTNHYRLPESLPPARAAAHRRSGPVAATADQRPTAGQSGTVPPPNPSIEPIEECSARVGVTAWRGPPEVWQAVEAARGSEFAWSYLARSRWDDEEREIRPGSGSARNRLMEIHRELGAIGVGVGPFNSRGPAQHGPRGEGVSKVQAVAI